MLFDTCIVIDLLRNRQAAISFVKGLSVRPSLSAVSATELFGGVRNTRERRQVGQTLGGFVVHDVDIQVASLAGDYVKRYGPSHGVGPIDAIIAATAHQHGQDLATLNLKHFPMFSGLKRPYQP